jgi:hypothetical protein
LMASLHPRAAVTVAMAITSVDIDHRWSYSPFSISSQSPHCQPIF